jgi:hypothetical protein
LDISQGRTVPTEPHKSLSDSSRLTLPLSRDLQLPECAQQDKNKSVSLTNQAYQAQMLPFITGILYNLYQERTDNGPSGNLHHWHTCYALAQNVPLFFLLAFVPSPKKVCSPQPAYRSIEMVLTPHPEMTEVTVLASVLRRLPDFAVIAPQPAPSCYEQQTTTTMDRKAYQL